MINTNIMPKLKLLAISFFLLLGFLVLAGRSFAVTPAISNVSGAVATGQTLTISGTNMVNEDKTNWEAFFQSNPNASGFEGSYLIADGYHCPGGGCLASLDNGSNRSWLPKYDTLVKLMGNQSMKFHVNYLDASNTNVTSYAYMSPGGSWAVHRWVRMYVRWDTNYHNSSHLKMFMTMARQSGVQPTAGLSSWIFTDIAGWVSGTPTPSGRIIYVSKTIDINRWYLVEVDYQEGSSPYTMTLYIDGQQVATGVQGSLNQWDNVEIGMINTVINVVGGYMDHWWDGFATSTSRIYGASTIEISNNSTYGQGTIRYQEPLYLSDGSVQIKADLTGLGSGPYYLWVTNNRQERSAAYNLSGGGDTTPPTVSISSPVSGSTISGSITVSANASDNVGIAGVQFKLDGADLGSEDTSSSYSISWNTTTASNGSHTLTAVARDTSNNQTASSGIIATVSNAPDTQAPTIPVGLIATAISSTQINLSWTVSTDNVGVTGYKIYRCQGTGCAPTAQIATTSNTTYSNTGLSPSTAYTYAVSAYDAAGNNSNQSAPASSTTQASGGPAQIIGLVRQDCSGCSNCYTSLSSWEAAYGGVNFGSCAQGDLVCADKIAIAQIDGAWTSPDTAPVTIDGWTTDATHYIKIYAASAARHDGKWNTGKYRLAITGINWPISNNENYARIDGLQISTQRSTAGYTYGIANAPAAGAAEIQISNCIIKSIGGYQGTANGGGIGGAYLAGTNAFTLKAWNNIIYSDTAGLWEGIRLDDTDWTGYVYNNTCYNMYYGYAQSSGAFIAKNNISYNNTVDYSGAFNSTSTHNLSKDATAPAYGTYYRNAIAAFSNINAGTEDLHLQSSDIGAKDRGADLSADSNLAFSDDTDGQTRTSAWDIGADEYISTDTTAPAAPTGLSVN